MAKKSGVWNLQQVRDKQLQSLWSYSGATNLFVVGNNYRGGLGQNSVTYQSSPVQIPGTTWSQVTCDTNQSSIVGLKNDGTLWAWGANSRGELGQNNTTRYSSPVQIGSGTDWNKITSNELAYYATKTDGTLWAWGYNQVGKLGVPSIGTGDRSSPVQVPGTTWDVKGQYNINAFGTIKTDGTLWTWGRNSTGQMGVNDRTHRSSPVQVGSSTDWAWITGGSDVAAINTSGELYTWGYGYYGSLGQNTNGPTATRSSPVQIPGNTWDKIAALQNGNAFMATKTDGTLWTWGRNFYGILGLNKDENNGGNVSSPTQVPGTNWAIPIGGSSTSSAFKTDGTLWSWGYNSSGQMGINNKTNYSSPVQVGSDTDWVVNDNSCGSSVSAWLKMM